MSNFNVTNQLFYNQTTIGASATQVSSTAKKCINGIVVEAKSTNTASIYVGDSSVSTSNGFELQPGQSIALPFNDPSNLYVAGTQNDVACWIGN